jgi:NAD(P)-dependent dehydrogenase (short-subunit alcohol dehydrogenase family)
VTGPGGELRFDGRVAIVTGAGRGIGRAYARLLAARGAAVVVNDILEPDDPSGSAPTTAEDIRGAGGAATPCVASVATADGAASIVDTALSTYGRLDILVNNAGLVAGTSFPEESDDDFRRHFDVHVLGTVMATRAAWPHLGAQGYGRIVNTTSGSVFGLNFFTAYVGAKGALLALTRSLAILGEPHGIHVNAVMPSADRPSALRETTAPAVGKGTGVFSAEMTAHAAAWLCHEQCPANGEIIASGGGRVSKVFLGETRGFADANLTMEVVRDRWDEVLDTTRFDIPRDGLEHRRISGEMVGE